MAEIYLLRNETFSLYARRLLRFARNDINIECHLKNRRFHIGSEHFFERLHHFAERNVIACALQEQGHHILAVAGGGSGSIQRFLYSGGVERLATQLGKPPGVVFSQLRVKS